MKNRKNEKKNTTEDKQYGEAGILRSGTAVAQAPENNSSTGSDGADVADAADFREGVVVAVFGSIVDVDVGRGTQCEVGWMVGAGAAGFVEDVLDPGFAFWAHGLVACTGSRSCEAKRCGTDFGGGVWGVGVAD